MPLARKHSKYIVLSSLYCRNAATSEQAMASYIHKNKSYVFLAQCKKSGKFWLLKAFQSGKILACSLQKI